MARISLPEKIVSYLILSAVGVLLFAPFVYMLSIAFASDATTVKVAFTLIPKEFNYENIIKVFTNYNLGTYLKNSIIITFFTVIGSVLSASFVAYGFSRIKAKGSGILFILLLST